MAEGKASDDTLKDDGDRKFALAKTILLFSLIGLFFLTVLLILVGFSCGSGAETAKSTFNAVLPLISTWIGTVLAYYFSKENFEAANRGIQNMVKQLTPTERLQSVAVKEKMIPSNKMICEKIDDDNISITKLTDLLKKLTETKVNRLPVLYTNENPRYMIHRSMIDKYLANKALSNTQAADLTILTLKNLIDDDSEIKSIFENGFALVNENGTLADAKQAMDKKQDCLDVFVTKNGSSSEPVLGWITNQIIIDAAK